MLDRIEKFTCGDKNFLYLDLSNFKTNDQFSEFIETAKQVIQRYEPNSIYTISNVHGIRFDTATKQIVSDWVKHNKPYVVKAAVVCADGIKKIMIKSSIEMGGRQNVIFAPTKEQAISLLIKD